MSKMREILAAVSAYKLEDADRQAQYKQLLKELNAIVVGKDFDEIWEDVKALAEFQQKLEAIMNLVDEEKEDKTKEQLEAEYDELVAEISCGIDESPEWCVSGKGHSDTLGSGVLFWIRPVVDDLIKAERLADIINKLGGKVTVENIDWFS